MGRRVTKTPKPAVKQCIGTVEFDNHVIANLAGHVKITEAIRDLRNKITSCETMINKNYKTEQVNAIAGINTSSKQQRQINDIIFLIENINKKIDKTAQTPPKQEELKTGPINSLYAASQLQWRDYVRHDTVNEAITPDVQYQRKTDENIKYVRDNVTYAMRHMCGWDIERKLGNSLFCRTLFKQRMDISVQFTDRTMSITFTRRDGQRVDEVFSDFGKGSTTLASIMMFYCLRS